MTFNQPKNFRIAFVAGNKNPNKFLHDPAFIYRCQNPALALAEKGFSVECVHYTELFRQKNNFQLVIFHRPSARTAWHGWLLRRVIKQLKKRGATVVADFDDLVFDDRYAEYSPGVINGYVTLAQTQKNFRQHAELLPLFDKLTVSTQPLKQYAEQFFDVNNLYWLPNSPHYHWRSISPSSGNSDSFVVKYLPGTRSHDQDFALLAEPLAEFLAQHADAQLRITGVLDKERLPKAIQQVNQQVRWQAKQPFAKYSQVVNDGNIHLAPLQNTPFNACKSALKGIEAGHFNRPTLASPIDDMYRLESAGTIVVNSAQQWFDALCAQYKQRSAQPDYRLALKQLYSAEQHADELVKLYEPKL